MIIKDNLPPKYLQEDSLSQECKKLLSTLPKEKRWIGSYIYKYQGFWTSPRLIQGVIACQQQFQAQDTDIILHSVFKQNHPLLVKNPHVLVPFLEHTLYVDGRIPDFSSFTSPRLLATHVPFASLPKFVQNSETKLVYLLDHKDTNSIEEMFDLFCKGVSIYSPFWDHVLDYWKQSIENPNKILFLMYEEMKEKPKIQLKRLAEFLECQFSIGEENCGVVDEILKMCSFENLSNLEVNTNEKLSTGEGNKIFFRKGEIGDWKNYFTVEMSEKLNRITEQKFYGSGLKFSYT
ncbi:hypothetical protein R3W88_007412 [Solanum pinnatisectum]|uniref:Sulfotransferase n=1 Tax=Solanum pinnatisectum TaxID=50273 RepID=A0AAV9M565_9SOLN|nr:hypothetical protein R3W88_007412 [Solanum pinnatisectum]